MAEPSDIPLVEPKEALAFFRGKGLALSFAWQDVLRSQHDYYFTIAKMMTRSLLEDAQRILEVGIEEGKTAAQIGGELKYKMLEAGWWGKKLQTDPLTGKRELVQLGSDHRIRKIVRINLRSTYSAARSERQERNKALLPIGVYKSRLDGRERPEHHAWHNTALLLDDPWWTTHTPPCDWECRCIRVTMTKGQAARRGLDVDAKPAYFGTRKWVNKRTGEVMEIEKGIGAGWDYHPGKRRLDGLAPEPLHRFSESENVASAVPESVTAFLAPFGFAEAGGIFTDAGGWPLAISPAWLDGLSFDDQDKAAEAAQTIATPDKIRELWISGKDGQLMLVRRYIRELDQSASVVDVHPAFWRFRILPVAAARLLDVGARAWSKDAG